jgi:ubiquinone/menaquinone biosynthesis C-methylase UbiE
LNQGSTVKVLGMAPHVHLHRPNHHADHRAFSGIFGFLMALGFTVGREGDAALAAGLTGLQAGDRVVDIGCGSGTAVRRAARLGAHVVGVDPAPVMLRVARLLPTGRRVTYRKGGAEALPLEDVSATIVWSIASVHHWPQLEAGLAEVSRVLAPGGRFLAIERSSTPGATGLESHGWTHEQAETFAEHCREAGLTDLRISTHESGRRTVVAVLAVKP